MRYLLLSLLYPTWLAAQDPPWQSARQIAAIPRAELDSITERGRRIAEYDAAAWRGTDMAMTRSGVFPHGGDVRYRISADGRELRSQRKLHNTILDVSFQAENKQPVAGYHSAVLADRPEDTDVFHVLSRTPRIPEYIVTASYFFRIDPDGRITAYDTPAR